MLQWKLIEFSLGQVTRKLGPSGGPLPTCSTPRGRGYNHDETGGCEGCRPFNEFMGQLTWYNLKVSFRFGRHKRESPPRLAFWPVTQLHAGGSNIVIWATTFPFLGAFHISRKKIGFRTYFPFTSARRNRVIPRGKQPRSAPLEVRPLAPLTRQGDPIEFFAGKLQYAG
jgi:hypothetical protein